MMPSRFHVLVLTLFLPILVLTSSCVTMRELEIGASQQLFSPEVEAELGQNFHEEISKDFNYITDPIVTNWLNRVGHELVAHSPPIQQQFNFYVTDSTEVNAFAIPGGHCYINLGLILYCDNEAQVVSVIGHEINHVTRRHGLLRLQRMMAVEAAASLASAASGSQIVQAAGAVTAQAGGYLALQRFSRDDEREADILGVRAMHKAGYDPREAPRFFEKLVELQGSRQPGYLENWLATHPATRDRVNYLNSEIQNLNIHDGLIVNSPEFIAVQRHLRENYAPRPAEETSE